MEPPRRGCRVLGKRPSDETEKPIGDESEDRDEVDVRRQREDRCALADATEITDGQDDDERDSERDADVEELRKDRRQRRDTRCDRNGHRQHVVGQQRGGSRKARKRPEVVARHDV